MDRSRDAGSIEDGEIDDELGAAASLIAQVAIWATLGIGVAFGEVGWRGALAFVLLWAARAFGLSRLSSTAAARATWAGGAGSDVLQSTVAQSRS